MATLFDLHWWETLENGKTKSGERSAGRRELLHRHSEARETTWCRKCVRTQIRYLTFIICWPNCVRTKKTQFSYCQIIGHRSKWVENPGEGITDGLKRRVNLFDPSEIFIYLFILLLKMLRRKQSSNVYYQFFKLRFIENLVIDHPCFCSMTRLFGSPSFLFSSKIWNLRLFVWLEKIINILSSVTDDAFLSRIDLLLNQEFLS